MKKKRNYITLILVIIFCFISLSCSYNKKKFNQNTKIELNQEKDTYSISINPLPRTKIIQILIDSLGKGEKLHLGVLSSCSGDSKVTLKFCLPEKYTDLYVGCIGENNYYSLKKFSISDNEVNFNEENSIYNIFKFKKENKK